MALVTVRFYKPNNPNPLQTVLSKENGVFELNKTDTGKYILSFTYTGFSEKKQIIKVESGVDLQIDPVVMTRVTGNLKEVIVNVKRPLVEQ